MITLGTAKTRFLQHAAMTTCWFIPLLALTVSLTRLKYGWDDGATTAAFARTFAQTGKIALTPLSEQVEGFSSFSWVMILSLSDQFIHSFTGMLVAMKVASAIAFAGSLFSFKRLAENILGQPYGSMAVLLLSFTITPFTEVFNGMEMNFYMLLVLCLSNFLMADETIPFRRLWWPALLSFAIILTRFEAPFLLCFLYLGLFLCMRNRGTIWLLSIADLAIFAVAELCRHRIFGEWLPNTIYAKQREPYSLPSLSLNIWSRTFATGEILFVLGAPILVLLGLWLSDGSKHRRSDGFEGENRFRPLLLSMSAGAVLLGLGIGRNWGHPGRMVLAFLPFIILGIVLAFKHRLHKQGFTIARVIVAVLIIQATVWAMQVCKAVHENRASLAYVERIGLDADQIRQRLDRPTLTAFISDIGASSLCCENLIIMDSAMLANHSLARTGYSGVKRFMNENHPEIVELHEQWETVTNAHRDHLLDEYGLVGAGTNLFFLRADLYHQLVGRGLHEIETEGNPERCLGTVGTDTWRRVVRTSPTSFTKCIAFRP